MIQVRPSSSVFSAVQRKGELALASTGVT